MTRPRVDPLPYGNERRPAQPVDRIYSPPELGARQTKVGDKDDWHSLAMKFWVDEKILIYYNFKTTEPAYVNWYLREYVGCVRPDDRRQNWKFSAAADPGVIWAPPAKPIVSRDVPTLDDSWMMGWGASLTSPEGGPHAAEHTYDVGHLVLLALELAGAHGLAATFGSTVGLIALPTMVLMAIGGAEMDGFAARSKIAANDGYSLGAVLGAKGTKGDHVQRFYFRQHQPDKKLENVYNASIAAGYLDGRKLNQAQVGRLFKILHKNMNGNIPKGDDWHTWSEANRKDYHERAAFAFKRKYLR